MPNDLISWLFYGELIIWCLVSADIIGSYIENVYTVLTQNYM